MWPTKCLHFSIFEIILLYTLAVYPLIRTSSDLLWVIKFSSESARAESHCAAEMCNRLRADLQKTGRERERARERDLFDTVIVNLQPELISPSMVCRYIRKGSRAERAAWWPAAWTKATEAKRLTIRFTQQKTNSAWFSHLFVHTFCQSLTYVASTV